MPSDENKLAGARCRSSSGRWLSMPHPVRRGVVEPKGMPNSRPSVGCPQPLCQVGTLGGRADIMSRCPSRFSPRAERPFVFVEPQPEPTNQLPTKARAASASKCVADLFCGRASTAPLGRMMVFFVPSRNQRLVLSQLRYGRWELRVRGK